LRGNLFSDIRVDEILRQHFEPLKVPVFTGAMFGHIDQYSIFPSHQFDFLWSFSFHIFAFFRQFTLPIGAMVEMDASAGAPFYYSWPCLFSYGFLS